MLAYLIVYACSVSLFYAGQKSHRGAVPLYICALLLPALLAGLRDYSIGTDVLVYGNAWFRLAVRSEDFWGYFNHVRSGGSGLLYALFNYIISRVFDSPHVFYFFWMLAELTLVFLAAKRLEDVVDVPFAMLTYYLLFYNTSLNILRQSMAMIIILFGYDDIRKNRVFRYGILVVVAMLFHASGIVGLALYVLHFILQRRLKKLWKFFAILCCGMAAVLCTKIAEWILQLGILGARYAHYLTDIEGSAGRFNRIVLYGSVAFLLFFLTVKPKEHTTEHEDIKMYMLCSFLFFPIGAHYGFANRILYYFDIFAVFGLPLLADHLRVQFTFNGKKRTMILAGMCMLVYWIVGFGYLGWSETVPYIMMQF